MSKSWHQHPIKSHREADAINNLYEKDYTIRETAEQKIVPLKKCIDALDVHIAEHVELYQRYLQVTPRHIIPEDQANYDYLLQRCDELAQLYGGKIWGFINDESYTAKIRLTLPRFIEFINADELLLLKEMADKSEWLAFRATEEGTLLITLHFRYFEEDESYADYLSRNIKEFIERKGLSLEEVSAQTDVCLALLTAIFEE